MAAGGGGDGADGRRRDVEISVVNHADPAIVRRCLETLPAACGSLAWGATVVENLPRAGPPLDEGRPWLRVVANAAPAGFGANHDAVLEPVVHGRLARHVLVLNDDAELAPHCVERLVAAADADPALGAVGPALAYPDGRPQPSFFSFPAPAHATLAALRRGGTLCDAVDEGVGWLSGACLLVRADAVRADRLFDPRFFMFFEDVDLCRRLWSRGWRVARHDGAAAVHHNHQTVGAEPLRRRMDRQMARSMHLYFEKHHGRAAATAVSAAWRARGAGWALRRLGRRSGVG